MDQQTRYAYEKKIKDLTVERDRLYYERQIYRDISVDIYDGIVQLVVEGKTINQGWILKQLRRAFK